MPISKRIYCCLCNWNFIIKPVIKLYIYKNITYIKQSNIPGHESVLQFPTSVSLPMHNCPSGSGAGLSQNLTRDLVPPSHDFEHSDHAE